jgi:hypothetical protein
MFKLHNVENEVLQLLILSWMCFDNIPYSDKKEQEKKTKILEYLNSLSQNKNKSDKKKLQIKIIFLISESKSKKQILREIKKYKFFYYEKNKIFNKPFNPEITIKDYYNYQQYVQRFEFFYKRNQIGNVNQNNIEIKIQAIRSLEILAYVLNY